ncbi:MAG: ABC transporter ATP-binding protein [Deltaproteobacteria bacterium]|nr:ABC transporter ATP-binding protein [Deltaproteobacteria bacterium]
MLAIGGRFRRRFHPRDQAHRLRLLRRWGNLGRSLTESKAPHAKSPLVLEAHGLRKSFNRFEVLRCVDMCVGRGEVYGFLGRNGAGKTTAIRTLMGILKSDAGRISFFGEPAASGPTRAQKQRIGYVSQTQHFYGWMTAERIGNFVRSFYPSWAQDLYQELLRVFDIPAKKRIQALSDGTRTKLALALALAHNPELLILDEPTAGLDPAARREFLEIVADQTQTRHCTTILSSHIVDDIERLASRVGILDQGRILFEGDLGDLHRIVRAVPKDRLAAWQAERPLPPGLTVRNHRGETAFIFGSVSSWDAAPEFSRLAASLGLEDIFLALVVKSVVPSTDDIRGAFVFPESGAYEGDRP